MNKEQIANALHKGYRKWNSEPVNNALERLFNLQADQVLSKLSENQQKGEEVTEEEIIKLTDVCDYMEKHSNDIFPENDKTTLRRILSKLKTNKT